MYSYSQVLKKAAQIAWKHPTLWFFGLLASVLGSAGEIELIFGGFQFSQDSSLFSFWQGLAQGGFFTFKGIQGFAGLLLVNPLSLFFITFIFLLVSALTIIVIWLVVVSQAALISQAVSVSKNLGVNFKQGFSLGMQKFFPIFGLNIIIKIFGGFLLFLTAGLALLAFPGSNLLFIISFDIFLVALLLLSFVVKFAICGTVLRHWEFKESIRQGYALFKKNWAITLEVAVLVFLAYLMVNALVVYIISQLFVITIVTFASFPFVLVLIFSLMFIAFFFVQALLAIFHWAAWAIVFELINAPQPVLISRIKKILRK